MRDAPGWLRRRLRMIGTLALAVATAAGDARAVSMIDSSPKVDEIVQGKATAFALRFDQLVNHRSSRLILVTPQGNRSLTLRLSTEPNTLYADAGPLPPGKYELQWEAHAIDGTIVKGSIPFTVAPQ